MYKIGLGRGKDGRVGVGLVGVFLPLHTRFYMAVSSPSLVRIVCVPCSVAADAPLDGSSTPVAAKPQAAPSPPAAVRSPGSGACAALVPDKCGVREEDTLFEEGLGWVFQPSKLVPSVPKVLSPGGVPVTFERETEDVGQGKAVPCVCASSLPHAKHVLEAHGVRGWCL